MRIQYFPNESPEELQEKLLIYEQDKNIHGIMLLACDGNNYSSSSIDPILQSINKPLFGGVFPALIFNSKKYEKGFIVAGLTTSPTISVIENISNPDTEFDLEFMKIAENYHDSKTMFVFIDGFAERINTFIEDTFTIFGLQNNYIGGGAGSLSLKQKPCIISNSGLKQDSAVIAGVNLNSGIGVKHGWETIAGPFKVTAAEKTVIKELDFKPAFEIYKQVVDQHSGKSIENSNFFEIAKAYPFGINKIDAEQVVRDPLFIGEHNCLICVGEVEKGSFVNILTGNKNTLIQAAKEAIETALDNKQGSPENFIFFVDCISRVLFLEDDFEAELKEVQSVYSKTPVFGLLSIGEIANNKKDYLEFHNKTSVIGCF